MADSTTKDIGDRLHDINKQVLKPAYTDGTLVCRRYWPASFFEAALHPLIVPVPGARTSIASPPAGAEIVHYTRTWHLMVVLGATTEGMPGESAQKAGETLLDLLLDVYSARPSLELNGALNNIVKTACPQDAGIITMLDNVIAVIRFPLEVTYRKAVTFAI